jgi:hypothetical protein
MLPRRRKEFPYLSATGIACFTVMSRPGGGSGNGHRASFRNPSTSFRLPAFGFRFLVSAPGLRIRKPGRLYLSDLRRAPSHLWLGAFWVALLAFTTLLFRPIPVRRNLCAWDCKVTPASCTCQEGNTIGCIPNNDGLDAGSGPCFPHCGKHGSLRLVDELAKFPLLGPYLAAVAGVAVEGNLGSHMREFTSSACAGTNHGDRETAVAISGEPQLRQRSRGAYSGVRLLTWVALPLQSRAART